LADDLYLTKLASYAVTNWLQTSGPVLDYANAMVSSQKTSVVMLETGWQQHVDGVSGSVSPQAPAKLTGSLWLIGGDPNCDNFSNSDQNTAASFVEILNRPAQELPQACWATCFWAARLSGQRHGLHVSARHMPERNGRRCDSFQHPHSDAGLAAELMG
jgi:hypothetical protein